MSRVVDPLAAELLAERFGPIPWRERYARPNPVRPTPHQVNQRRIGLCGTADLNVTDPQETRRRRERGLVAAIRRWV